MLDANPRRSFSPSEEQADIARHPVRKVEHPRRKMETLRLQIQLPPQIDLSSLPAQRRRPTRFGDIHRTAAIASELAWEAKEHELLSPALGRPARLVNQIAPVFVRDMAVDQLRHFLPSFLRCALAQLLAMLHFLALMIRDQLAEIGDGETGIIRSRHRRGAGLGLTVRVVEKPVERRKPAR
jgi:hypothetical protein